ncbi:hypothetical protein PROFUN_11145 [Planoprotostelium fungivorum]|uniref:Transcription factor CBF/NF-Y/archaeal histone domain-containing protein n=1 Tax=Planoprotostelium fungivorum TaxID=1890364 RepID=A0A2P6NAT8_9EUKA|nr:hypothetical protein PROFUN_11145 [Planoprotostelium fungivorum]
MAYLQSPSKDVPDPVQEDFWKKVEENVTNSPLKAETLPAARIKQIMKSDADVKMINAKVPILMAKACEIFIWELTQRAWSHSIKAGRKTLQRNDIATAITKTDMYDFLIDFVPRDEEIYEKQLRTKVARSNNDGYVPLTIKPRDSNMDPPFPIDASQTAALYHNLPFIHHEEVDHHGNIFGGQSQITEGHHQILEGHHHQMSMPESHQTISDSHHPISEPHHQITPGQHQINEGHQMVNDAHSHPSLSNDGHHVGSNMEDHLGLVESQSKEEKDERDLLHLSARIHVVSARVAVWNLKTEIYPQSFSAMHYSLFEDRERDLQDVRQRDVSKRHSNSLSRQHHICNFNKGMLHHSFGIAPSQSTKECALDVDRVIARGNTQEQQQMSDRFPPIRGTVKPQEPVLPPVVALPARQSPLYASPLPPVTARTTENTPVVDVVHAAQVPNMAPSAVAQPPVIHTELDLLTIRQRGNLLAAARGIVRLEDLSDVDRQEIDRLEALIEADSSSQA